MELHTHEISDHKQCDYEETLCTTMPSKNDGEIYETLSVTTEQVAHAIDYRETQKPNYQHVSEKSNDTGRDQKGNNKKLVMATVLLMMILSLVTFAALELAAINYYDQSESSNELYVLSIVESIS